MATITVSEQDVINADTYLATYLKEKIPEADFSQGSVVRDFVVKAVAHIFAFFRAEIQQTRNQQSLLALQTLEPSAEVDEAVDAILSNLFIGRRDGAAARVVVTLHFTNRVDVVISPATRFIRGGIAFTTGLPENLVIAAATLRQVTFASAAAAEYVTTLTLVCTTVGESGNIIPGRFSGADRFNTSFAYAENLDYGAGGKGIETTAALLERSPVALSVRNLVNVRSVQAVLLDAFPTLTGVFTAGFGDPEMTRDLAAEGVTQIEMHVGGHMDVYVKLPVVVLSESGFVGAESVRPDGVINVFRDVNADFNANPQVFAGDVLKIQSGIAGAPREWLIKEVHSNGTRLTVSESRPFAQEASALPYTVGAQSPSYADKRTGSTTGETLNIVSDGCAVYLTGRPRGKMRQVEEQVSLGVWQALERVNTVPTTGEYTMESQTPTLFQTSRSVEKIEVHTASMGRELRFTFDTLAGFDTVNARVTDNFERNVCSNNLARGFIPVYVGVTGTYALAAGAAPVTDGDLRKALATFLNEWDAAVPLDVSAVTTFLRNTFPSIGRFYDPTTIFFTLYAPDGQLYEFQTTDVVTVFPDGVSNVSLRGTGARLLRDEASLGGLRTPEDTVAFAASLQALQGIFMGFGITQRNVRYLPDEDTFSIIPYVA